MILSHARLPVPTLALEASGHPNYTPIPIRCQDDIAGMRGPGPPAFQGRAVAPTPKGHTLPPHTHRLRLRRLLSNPFA